MTLLKIEMQSSDEHLIRKLFEDGDRALISADVAELQRIYADDYVQCDESGNPSNRGELIRSLTSGVIRFISMRSTGRHIRQLTEDVAVVHGSEEDEMERGGRLEMVRYIYMDVVARREDRWQITASQLARPLVE